METYCGTVGIIGRANVGKSTLLNEILGVKVSATSSKPQTTQKQILGIYTDNNKQLVFLDTPGFHQGQKKYSNRLMNKVARSTIEEAEILLWVIDSAHFNHDDQAILQKLILQKKPVIVALNKKDQVSQEDLFKLTAKLALDLPTADFVPCSAKHHQGINEILNILLNLLMPQAFLFSPEEITYQTEKNYAAEMIREKIMRYTGQEIPYICQIEIEEYLVKNEIIHILATIWVNKESQKGILVGKNGMKLKEIGQEARLSLEKFWEQKVFLKLWVKVKKAGFMLPKENDFI